MITFTSRDAFCEFIAQQLSRKDYGYKAFVILRYAYTQKELMKKDWTTEVMEPDWGGNCRWHKGEQLYEVAAVMSADELADFVIDRLFYHLGG